MVYAARGCGAGDGRSVGLGDGWNDGVAVDVMLGVGWREGEGRGSVVTVDPGPREEVGEGRLGVCVWLARLRHAAATPRQWRSSRRLVNRAGRFMTPVRP